MRGSASILMLIAFARAMAFLWALLGQLYGVRSNEIGVADRSLSGVCASAFVYSLIVLSVGLGNRILFASPRSRLFQIGLDLSFITAICALNLDPHADFFALYVLPLFIAVEFYPIRGVLLILTVVVLGTAVAGLYITAHGHVSVKWLVWVAATRIGICVVAGLIYMMHRRLRDATNHGLAQQRQRLVKLAHSEIDGHSQQVSQAFESELMEYENSLQQAVRLSDFLAKDYLTQLVDTAEAALTAPDPSDAIQQILGRMAMALNCKVALFRKEGINDVGEPSLELISTYGYTRDMEHRLRHLEMSSGSYVIDCFQANDDKCWTNNDISKGNWKLKYFDILIRVLKLHSAICVRVDFREFHGIIGMYRDVIRPFTPEEQTLFRLLSRYAAFVYANSLQRLLRERKDGEHRLTLLANLSKHLDELDQFNHERDNKNLWDFVAKEVVERLNAEACGVYLRRGDLLKRKAFYGLGDKWDDALDQFTLGQGMVGEAYTSHEPIVSNDVETDPRAYHPILNRYRRASRFRKIKHFIAVQIGGQLEEPLGVIRVLNKIEPNNTLSQTGFIEADVQLFRTVGALVGNSIESLKQKHQLRELSQLSQDIRLMTNDRHVLGKTVSKAFQLVGADRAIAILFSEDRSLGIMIAANGNGNLLLPPISLEHDEVVANAVTAGHAIQINTAIAWSFIGQPGATELAPSCSSIVVPLTVNGEIRALLSVDSLVDRQYTAQEIDIINAVANVASTAMEHTRQYEHAGRFAVEQERRRLYQDLHTAKGWVHAMVMMPIDTLLAQLRDKPNLSVSATRRILKETWRSARFIYSRLDYVMQDIPDPVLALEGLTAAIDYFGRKLAQDSFKLLSNVDKSLGYELEVCLYRIAQEAITNAAQHGRWSNGVAKDITVDLRQEDEAVTMTVTDNGGGISKDVDTKSSLGIAYMHELAAKVDAELYVQRTSMGVHIGTKVSICVLLKRGSGEGKEDR